MSASIKITKRPSVASFDATFNIQIHKDALEAAMYTIGSDVVDETVKLIETGSRSGRMYGNHKASAPGEAPASRSGKLSQSTDYKVRNFQEMTVGMTAHYAGYLEYGTRGREEDTFGAGRFGQIAPRPSLGKAVHNEAQNTVNTILESVDRAVKR